MTNQYTLEPLYTNQKSFYNKAVVVFNDSNASKDLYSYGTLVARIETSENADFSYDTAVVFGTYSMTTLKHIKEFLKQNGFEASSKKQIESDFIGA